MNNCHERESQQGDDERQTNLLNVVAGNGPGEYFVLVNWYYLPIEPEDINGCVVLVSSMADNITWKTLYSLNTWLFVLKRLTENSLLLGTAGEDLIRINGQIEIIKTGLVGGGVTDIWVINPNNCWLAHDEGLAHWDGKRVSKNRHSATIHTIHALSAYFAVAVGAEGIVLIFDGKTWCEVDSSPTNKTLVGVFCSNKNNIYICGWRGALYKWDGKDKWVKIKFSGDVDAHEINLASPIEFLGNVYVCAGGNGLYKIQGKKAEQVYNFYASHATVIDGKLIVTGGNLFHEFDGVDWKQVKIILPE